MKTKEVVPYAILKTQDKNEYYLLASGASEPEDWMHEQQQKFLVVPSHGVWQKHYIITTNPEIRVFANSVTERVQILEVDEGEVVLPVFDSYKSSGSPKSKLHIRGKNG